MGYSSVYPKQKTYFTRLVIKTLCLNPCLYVAVSSSQPPQNALNLCHTPDVL